MDMWIIMNDGVIEEVSFRTPAQNDTKPWIKTSITKEDMARIDAIVNG